MKDPREAAAQYRADQARRQEAIARGENPDDGVEQEKPTFTAERRAAFVEHSLEQARRAGAFDNLPGAGKPLPNIGGSHDPDWWIRRKIETEHLTGLGPPALRLRVEHEQFHETLDAITREADVRAHVEDFNRRVIEARRQLMGGPPVITPTRDVENELVGWRERRAARAREAARQRAAEEAAAAASAPRRRRWFKRRT
ncbi:protein of unknown function [Paramicrobacterium humi]|uniref:DnaJ homologue subfamily C member 28 conserved domain-containing protein n=1 Tax=Paramicrobacterium humi TaxID=640635 RepID=A0A1H4IWL6_9MICO|nr:DUF1992 domain-containing protein [Microbacterium humi]SEB38459.1 protein of unknown function [Microbacterium humi]